MTVRRLPAQAGDSPHSGLEQLCAWLSGREPPVLEPSLLACVRRAAGLVTHPAAVTRGLCHAVEVLTEAGARLVSLFGPEHGIRGEAPDGRPVSTTTDPRSGLPLHSLYRGGAVSACAPTPEMFAGIEVLLVDLQDVGARFYTYASTLSLCMEAAVQAGVPVVVLDRPNPLGRAVEGPLLRSRFTSFVGLHPVPIRHGCTLGELARLFHRAYGVGEEPAVVPAAEARGAVAGAPDTLGAYSLLTDGERLPWVPPSPNLPTPLSALVYAGTALVEGTNLSEGRGTGRPFEWVGAPWIDADRLAERLTADSLPGAAFRPIHFIPTTSKWAGESCAGVHLHVTDVDAFRPVFTAVALLAAVRELWPVELTWRESSGGFFIDRLAGTDTLRHAIDDRADPRAIAASWTDDEASFRTLKQDKLYGEQRDDGAFGTN